MDTLQQIENECKTKIAEMSQTIESKKANRREINAYTAILGQASQCRFAPDGETLFADYLRSNLDPENSEPDSPRYQISAQMLKKIS